LELDPRDRWPSMDALLAAITRRPRWPFVAAGVGAVMLATAAILAMPHHEGRSLPAGLAEVTRFSEGASVTRDGMAGLLRELHERSAARFVPSFIAGQPAGLKLFALKRDTFLDAIGVANADLLVSIDAHPTTTLDQLDEALAAVGPSPARLDLGLMRGHQPVTLSIKLK
ncbi:MAG: hypothetical protein JO257_31210, partial [Deltaproteobacteria bacterium]|nr:hypothetical protein [Deltaproteobacteria bacterium]